MASIQSKWNNSFRYVSFWIRVRRATLPKVYEIYHCRKKKASTFLKVRYHPYLLYAIPIKCHLGYWGLSDFFSKYTII